ncbi:MAG: acyl-CoA thioesterase [bacterium]|nr:acyl-CoA thioesterase [bacterium]
MAYEHQLQVRYGETDQMGVVHHANYLLYMEEARTAYMEALGCPYREVEERGIGLPVRRIDLRYRASARYADKLTVTVQVGRLRAASVAFEYEIERAEDGVRIASGTIELACIELKGGPRLLPEDLREALATAAS